MKKTMSVLIALLLAGCGAGKEKAADDAQSAPAQADDAALQGSRELTDRNAPATDLAPVAKIGGVEGRSPFEGERVVDLNAIVKKSLETVREFDKQAPAIRAAVAAAAKPGATQIDKETADTGITAINALYDRAKASLDEMARAETAVKESGEYFDESILGGMVKFTQDVELELREEKAELAVMLAGEAAP